jgi:hypothetical protein
MMRKIKELYFLGIGIGFFGFIVSGMVVAEAWIATTSFFSKRR